MLSPSKYISKTFEIEAVQWGGQNLVEVAQFLGICYRGHDLLSKPTRHLLAFFSLETGMVERIPENDWVIKDQRIGGFRSLTAIQFVSEFSLITDAGLSGPERATS